MVSLVISIIVMLSTVFAFPSQAAQNDFSMKPFDKGYITFLFDDGRMPFSEECFKLFRSFKMPMCCALVAKDIMDDETTIKLFLQIQDAGGEILSHTYDHTALVKNMCTVEFIEKQLGDSYRVLTGLGFNINGIIEAGNGGDEKTADYELVETISRKYYKYSNAYGVSPQYKFKRNWLSGKSLSQVKSMVDDAIKNKSWLTLWGHEFKEFSKGCRDN
jgi:hypothetical protein